MAIPKEQWGWWGNEGGHRLDVKRVARGVELTTTSDDREPVTVTLADFRVHQLREWLALDATPQADAAQECPACKAAHVLHTPERYIGTNMGHGHAWERPDGLKARCGGPGICAQCSKDAAMVARARPAAVQDAREPVAGAGEEEAVPYG